MALNPIDQMSAEVMTACNGPLHGRPAIYYTVGGATQTPLNVIIKPDAWKSMFDTGSDSLDFEINQCFIGRNDLPTTPVEVGRGTTGDYIIFNDFLSVTWWVRNIGATPDYSGAYYDLVLSNYNGPINGV
jgi:hypothetical protein